MRHYEQYHEVDGFYISKSFPVECVRSALRYKAQPGDLFIIGYPKCGTTWMQHIVYNIINDHPPPKNRLLSRVEMPFLEAQGAESVEDMKRPGPIKTHMAFRFQPYSKAAKYIYVARNPYDCCVSHFYHTKHMPEYHFEDGTFDEFFDMFVEGKVDFGDYFDHLLSCHVHRDDPNVLFVTYEQLKKDIKAWVLKIADFIGEEFGQKLRSDSSRLENVLLSISVKNMRETVNDSMKTLFDGAETALGRKVPKWVALMRESIGAEACDRPMTGDFVRKGVVGDWRNHFSEDQVKRLKKRIREKTLGSDVMKLWKDVDIPH
ncbi:sulfotransferase ssu-1-like isoform X2 [Dermacentor andersoni]|uniref:sulfotransferase ssu-1-like isoform X2 n=1 Tax=Dermacentor andersoni TaxID=34620 RepID=UPI0024167FFF|nr:sulfotransferase ssu-1-like isoform X2 [Dermacentor andersoni]XP_054928341.1 sulfotransferase ssu-1-like isoform X2 [Dermacentor andersoni]